MLAVLWDSGGPLFMFCVILLQLSQESNEGVRCNGHFLASFIILANHIHSAYL